MRNLQQNGKSGEREKPEQEQAGEDIRTGRKRAPRNKEENRDSARPSAPHATLGIGVAWPGTRTGREVDDAPVAAHAPHIRVRGRAPALTAVRNDMLTQQQAHPAPDTPLAESLQARGPQRQPTRRLCPLLTRRTLLSPTCRTPRHIPALAAPKKGSQKRGSIPICDGLMLSQDWEYRTTTPLDAETELANPVAEHVAHKRDRESHGPDGGTTTKNRRKQKKASEASTAPPTTEARRKVKLDDSELHVLNPLWDPPTSESSDVLIPVASPSEGSAAVPVTNTAQPRGSPVIAGDTLTSSPIETPASPNGEATIVVPVPPVSPPSDAPAADAAAVQAALIQSAFPPQVPALLPAPAASATAVPTGVAPSVPASQGAKMTATNSLTDSIMGTAEEERWKTKSRKAKASAAQNTALATA
ncbi:hypothetical protein DFH09DRAFT_1095541 [Mycena vulgaris]|nr:hypothetical protein DFH09DRAFT_1095541 [Mycena vulgaris]